MGNAVSIHTPREGGDRVKYIFLDTTLEFQSTPPARGATPLDVDVGIGPWGFNPHPPRGGRRNACKLAVRYRCFNPHPPRGGRRPLVMSHVASFSSFNPHPPRGGRPVKLIPIFNPPCVSIHTPREGGDVIALFQFTRTSVSIHTPREGGDLVWAIS